MVPQLFAEGGYNQRLEVISDIPKGKVVWWFDLTDMALAKKTVGPGGLYCRQCALIFALHRNA